ncbi:S-adenosyl-L-methionine-dependent methyltransferase [Dichomitus squalens]|uniref:Trimethylguanosine synthase n=1 Tax=Dichomitus squalens TaxID=114155 RepID=A0A4V2JZ98_9APHY|nr:S-adenosyl-L-methionine-dependent methyltransferase [Dichomitus squalens]
MGKRKSNISGLARFVFEVVQDPRPQPINQSPEASPEGKAAASRETGDNGRGDDALDTRPKKKPKLHTGLLGPGLEKYDATGLVPFYTDASQVPQHLQKYFSQRERFFSLYSSGCLLDEEGWYSVTPEAIADQIAERCRCNVILDAFCGVGGNAIAFAKTCERVIALDISPVRLALARHNAVLYGVEDRIEFILADFFSFARTLKQRPGRKIDVVFLSPPWGGPSYLSVSPSKTRSTPSAPIALEDASEDTYAEYSLSSVRPVHGTELFKIARDITQNIAYFLPRNTSLEELSGLVASDGASGSASEMIEVEEEWMGSKLKALTCYFGGLVAGQELIFNA